MDDRDSHVIISTLLDDYKVLFDFDWAKDFQNAAEGTRIESEAQAFLLQWRGVGNTFRLPYMMMAGFDSFVRGYTSKQTPLCAELVLSLRDSLVEELGERLGDGKKKQLQRAINRIARRLPGTFELEELTSNSLWQEYTKTTEMQFCLWGSQQLCFTAIYFAYESFLLECLRKKLASPKATLMGKEETERLLKLAFDEATLDMCWRNDEIQRARICRHVIAHNGGRATEALRKTNHSLQIADGFVQIQPSDNRKLFDLLKGCASHLLAYFCDTQHGQIDPLTPAKT